MNNKYLFILLAALLISIGGYTQSNFGFSGGVPLKENYAPLFGKDIIINDQPNQDQRNVRVCSAFNGWLYSAICYVNPANFPILTIMKSIDNGISWSVLSENLYPLQDYQFKTMDIKVLGDSVQNLKLIIALVIKTQSFDMGEGFCYSFNGITGDYENTLLDEDGAFDMALATDNGIPATNSYPSSVGLLCSKSGTPDTLFFFSSSNGGLSLDSKRTVVVTQKKLLNVALTYGKCATYPNGNYFGVWLEHDNYGDLPGHIYTAHTFPYFNSQFTPAINLDSLDSRNINNCKNPSISCQYGNFDNDSSNMTEVVLFDAINQSTQSEDIKGYYNINAFNHSSFNRLIISDSSHQNVQPDVNFNPFDSTFMVTYYDKSLQRLPYLTNNFNLKNPDTWQFISSGYNDSTTLSAPYPKVALSMDQKKGVSVWTREGDNGNGIAMFDSPSSTWTSVSENNLPGDALQLGLFPNPCNSQVTIWFDLQKNANVSIKAYTTVGQVAAVFTDQNYKAGKHELKCNVNNLLPGSYILKLKTEDGTKSIKLIVVR
jgi:hypothetical protein